MKVIWKSNSDEKGGTYAEKSVRTFAHTIALEKNISSLHPVVITIEMKSAKKPS